MVACKIIEYENHGREVDGQIESFKREVAAYSEIQAKNIIRMIGYNTRMMMDGARCVAIITELMAKGSLASLLRKEEISLRRRFSLANHIACGMLKIHQLGYIHRDIRPDNILIDENYVAKIADMGIAREFSNAQRQMTQIGCQPYMPWEFFKEGSYSKKLDIFTFGLTINELFGGSHHQKFDESGEKIKKLAPYFQNLIRSCCSRVPANRPTADDIYSDLKKKTTQLNEHFAKHEDAYNKLSVEDKNKWFFEACRELSIL